MPRSARAGSARALALAKRADTAGQDQAWPPLPGDDGAARCVASGSLWSPRMASRVPPWCLSQKIDTWSPKQVNNWRDQKKGARGEAPPLLAVRATRDTSLSPLEGRANGQRTAPLPLHTPVFVSAPPFLTARLSSSQQSVLLTRKGTMLSRQSNGYDTEVGTSSAVHVTAGRLSFLLDFLWSVCATRTTSPLSCT